MVGSWPGLFATLAKAGDGAFLMDQEQHILYRNPVAQLILAYAPDEVIDRNCWEILRDDSHRRIYHYRSTLFGQRMRAVACRATLCGCRQETVAPST